MFRFLLLSFFIIFIDSKTIFPWNLTTISKKSSTIPTQTTTLMETSTIFNISTTTVSNPSTTTTIAYEETTTAKINNKSYEFQSNFSRNNDSVFVSLHSNASNVLVSINNTFSSNKYGQYPCEILFNEYTMSLNTTKTTILIHFNGTFTRDLAIQVGDRFLDIADLLVTVRTIENQNTTVETV